MTVIHSILLGDLGEAIRGDYGFRPGYQFNVPKVTLHGWFADLRARFSPKLPAGSICSIDHEHDQWRMTYWHDGRSTDHGADGVERVRYTRAALRKRRPSWRCGLWGLPLNDHGGGLPEPSREAWRGRTEQIVNELGLDLVLPSLYIRLIGNHAALENRIGHLRWMADNLSVPVIPVFRADYPIKASDRNMIGKPLTENDAGVLGRGLKLFDEVVLWGEARYPYQADAIRVGLDRILPHMEAR